MNFNKRFLASVLLATLVVVAVFGFGASRNSVVRAQDGMITCDVTLISLLYISEHVYGHFPMTDTSNIDKGQYAPLFDAMMEMMAQMEPTEEMVMTEEAMMEPTEEMMMTEEAMMEGMTELPHGDVAGEDPTCTALRAELDAWFLTHFKHEMEMMQ